MIARIFVTLIALTTVCLAADKPAEKTGASPVLSQTVKDIDGNTVALSTYKGKVLLIVNVASDCGYTPQYKGLQQLHDKYAKAGLAVLGFPCNQFGGQEPDGDAGIKQFCQRKYKVKFDMFSKIDVNGPDAPPLFKHLTSKQAGIKDAGPVKWNFEKFLVDRQGRVVARFRSDDEPLSPGVTQAIEAALAAAKPD